jgi:hypothetical protein
MQKYYRLLISILRRQRGKTSGSGQIRAGMHSANGYMTAATLHMPRQILNRNRHIRSIQ